MARAMGDKRIATLYRLTSRSDPPSRIDLPTLEVIIDALRRTTGEKVEVSDLLEAIEEEPLQAADDLRTWHDATLEPPLEADAHGQLDPEQLGEPLHYDPDRGWVGGEER